MEELPVETENAVSATENGVEVSPGITVTPVQQDGSNGNEQEASVYTEEEERKRKEEEECKRKEEEKKRIEEAEKKRLAEEAERKRLAEEAERKRLAEEAERKRLAEEAERKHHPMFSDSDSDVYEQAQLVSNVMVAKTVRVVHSPSPSPSVKPPIPAIRRSPAPEKQPPPPPPKDRDREFVDRLLMNLGIRSGHNVAFGVLINHSQLSSRCETVTTGDPFEL